jgi:nucleotide-binding universal stress UspA family protein
MRAPRVLVGVDFSPEADLAARQAVEVARHIGGDVVLAHCGETVELPELGDKATAAGRMAFEAYRAELAAGLAARRSQLGVLREQLSGPGAIVSQTMCEGFPDSALCRAGDEFEADLMVVGTHGRTGLRWFLLGSIAEQVVRQSSIDVLVARREGAGRGGFERILVATDFSSTAEHALDRALELAAKGAQVDVVHFFGLRLPSQFVSGVPMALPGPPDQLEVEIAAAARERGEELVAPRRGAAVTLSFHVAPGTPIPGIVHRIEGAPYDLAALGSHGRRGFRRFAFGSVAETVVHRAACSVLVARGRS